MSELRKISLTNTQYSDLATDLEQMRPMISPYYQQGDVILINYTGVVVPKGRARQGQHGHYTPEATRKFEAAIKKLGKAAMTAANVERYSRPVLAHLTVWEAIPQGWGSYKKHLAMTGLLLPNRCDLDNQEKAIFDALNEVCYVDDCQISQKFSMRRFAEQPGFQLSLSPMGISYSDGITLENIIKQRGKK